MRHLTNDDAAFIVELLNDASFIQYIGDKGVRTEADACNYIQSGPVASYERFGFGLYLVEQKETMAAMGICGLLRRDYLEAPDIGFAFLPKFRFQGYAVEAAQGVKEYARQTLQLTRLLAITSLNNQGSIRVLEKTGFHFEKIIQPSADAEGLKLFACNL